MKIGVFDSGLGGLIVTKALALAFPKYDFAYLGDTANLPYGNKSADKIYEYSVGCVDYLFREKNAGLIIVACNTAAALALRKLQQEWLPKNFPDRRILGIAIPTLEYIAERGYKNTGLIATNATVQSGIYDIELKKINPEIKIESRATPLLVPLIEDGGDKYAPAVLSDYLAGFEKKDALILGCTHYPIYKDIIRKMLPNIAVVSQDEIIPDKFADYLSRHPELESKLDKNGTISFGITDMTKNYASTAARLFGQDIKIETAVIDKRAADGRRGV